MPEITERLYEKRDSTERFRMEPFEPKNDEERDFARWPHNKQWWAVNLKTGERTLITSQEIQLWNRTGPPPPEVPKKADEPPTAASSIPSKMGHSEPYPGHVHAHATPTVGSQRHSH